MMMKSAPALLAATALLASSVAFAADSSQVEVTLRAFKVDAALGHKRVPSVKVRPGDVIEYQVTCRNPGRAAARQVDATMPVPGGGMAYLEESNSMSAGPMQASVDGVHFATAPLKREVLRQGRRVTETVPIEEYRFLRWRLGDLDAGQQITVSARMRQSGPNDKPV